MNLSDMHGIVLGRTVSRLLARLLFAIIAAQACGSRTGLNEGLASNTGGLPAIGGATASGGSPFNGGSSTTTSTGGAPGTPMTSGIGGTSSSPATPRTGGATSSSPGCEYQGRWYPAGSFWESGDGCGCTGISMDGGVTVMRVCTEHICYPNGFVSIAGVGTYCVVEADASLD